MSDRKPLACIVLAAGRGTRMESDMPKALHRIAGRPLIGWVLDSVAALSPVRSVIVAGPGMPDLAAAAGTGLSCETAVQERPLGTGDAVRAALPLLAGFSGDILILMADMPLLDPATLEALVHRRYHDSKTGLAVLGAEFADPPAYGRLILGADGAIARIVEDKDCSVDERGIRLCNAGAYCADGLLLPQWIAGIGNDNAQKEFYLTDIVAAAARDGVRTHACILRDTEIVRGVNTRSDLAVLEAAVQDCLRARAMAGGATLIDPRSTYFSWDTVTGRDVIIEPGVFCGPGVTLGDRVHVRAFSHLEGATIAPGAAIGPFARLRPGADIGPDCRIGNFVEVKNATLGRGVKAGHLGYIGDADIGAGVNFSCGAITVNYDGSKKHRTVVGDGAMVGSNVNLVAPVEIGAGAYIGAGSTITKDVPADALAVAREKPVIKEGWAAARRGKRSA